MRNEDYINTLMRVNKKIYIDTASLMDVEGLELFIVKVEKTLLTNSRKITVPRSVCLELTRHLGSNYDRRAKIDHKSRLIFDQLEPK